MLKGVAETDNVHRTLAKQLVLRGFNSWAQLDCMDMRDMVATELERRQSSTGVSDRGLLSHKSNDDLKELWIRFRLKIASEPDFADIYARYFDKDDSIGRSSWPSSYMVERTQEGIGKLVA